MSSYRVLTHSSEEDVSSLLWTAVYGVWTQSEGVIISLHPTESNDFASSQPIPGPLQNVAFQRI